MAKISPLMALPVLVFASFIGLALIGMMRDDPDSLPSAREGQVAPPVVLTEFAGKPMFDDAALRDGTVKIVNYWASWCAPCRAEHPILMGMAEDGVNIIGLNYKDQPDNALAFLEELDDPFAKIGTDQAGRTGLEWGVYGIPETFVIDGNGKVLYRHPGPLTQRVLEERIYPAMAAAAETAPSSE